MGTKTRTKLYSALLSVMMLVNLVPTPALAEGEPQPTETPVIIEQTETPAAEPETNTTEEPTPTPVTEEVPVIPVNETPEPVSTDAPVPEQQEGTPAPEETPAPEQEETQDEKSEETEADSEENKEESEEAEDEKEKKVSYPAVTLSETVDGVTVTLKAPEGSLPEGVHMTVSPVHEQAIFKAVDDTLAEEGKELASAVAFDITLYDKDDNELQPSKYVTVSFSNTNLSSTEGNGSIDVYRVSDDASEVTPVTTVAATETNQMFITDHFTIYVSGKGNTADPNGDGSYKENGQGHRYYLEYGESITLESNESSIFTDEWYIHGTTYNGAITQTDDRTFKNTNLLESYEIATIAHKYGFLGNSVEYFFVSLRPQTKYQVELYFCGAGESQFTEIYNEKIKKNFPANPPKKDQYYQEGGTTYIFSGWCSNRECTNPIPVRDLNRVEKDITAYGKYTESENTYAVVFNGNADDCTYIPTTLYGSANPVTDKPFKYAERPAYTCKGWATSLERASNGIVDYLYPYEGGFVIPEGKQVLELYAVWEETDETLSYAPNNYSWGSVSRPYEYVKAINGTAQGATATAKDGYRFVKWTDNKGNVLSTEPTFVPQKTDEGYYVYVRHTAVFEPITYTVTFETNGGSEVSPQTVIHGSNAQRPSPDPTKGQGTCFEFNNWYADANLSTVFDFNQPITADTTVYAKWNSNNHSLTYSEEQNATCTEAGHIAGYTCSNCGKHFSDESGENEIKDSEWTIEALGHDWETSYVWNDNYTSITATRTCKRDSSHLETQNGTISTYHRDASCTEKERIIYVATFTNINFQTQVKGIDISPALGHDWGERTYTWDEDNSRVIGVVHCNRNNGHVEAESVNTIIIENTATCDDEGKTIFKAEFKNELFTNQTKEVDTPALGHDWANPTYTWSDDYTTVTAKRICKRDRSHSEEETVLTTHYDSPATCTMPSATVYVAAFNNPAFGVQTKRIEGGTAPTGHDWGDPTYEWDDDNSRVFATRHCKNDPKHVDVIVVETSSKIITEPTCTKPGEITYTADFSEYDTPYETQTKTIPIPALGHNWQSLSSNEIDWNDNHTQAKATFTCERCLTETTEKITSTSVESYHQDATCTSHEFTTYTVFFPEGFPVYRETIVSSDEPSHQWERIPSSYVWSEDYSLAVAIRHCKNDRSHVETLVVESTEKITTPPTCETPGKADYSANFGKEGYEIPDAKNIDIPALGHDWGAWVIVKAPTTSEKGLKERTCKHDATHKETEEIPVLTPAPSNITPAELPLIYHIVEGADASYAKNSWIPLAFTYKRTYDDQVTFSHFTGLEVDGIWLGSSLYTAVAGSVVITLNADYLETLEIGKHTITAYFDDGNAVTSDFYVGIPRTNRTPNTEDDNRIPMWALIEFYSITLSLIIIHKLRTMS